MHPAAEDLLALAAHGEVTLHVLGCRHCGGLLRSVLEPERSGQVPPLDFGEPLELEGGAAPLEETLLMRALEMVRVEEVLSAAGRQQAREVFEELLRYPAEARAEAVEAEARFRTSPARWTRRGSPGSRPRWTAGWERRRRRGRAWRTSSTASSTPASGSRPRAWPWS